MAEPRANPKRRWRQFSLRTLFALVTLCAVLSAAAAVLLNVAQTRREQAALKKLPETDGLHVGFYEVEYHASSLPESWSPYCRRVKRFELDISGRDPFVPLGVFRDVEHVEVSTCGPFDLASVAPLIKLETLVVFSAFVPIRDLSPLAGLKNLRHLTIEHVVGCDLSPLSSLTRLKELQLSGSVEGTLPLANLRNLRQLQLMGLSDRDLPPLAALSDLEELSFESGSFDDLTPLAALQRLRSLKLCFVSVPDEQIESLRRALPSCEITRE